MDNLPSTAPVDSAHPAQNPLAKAASNAAIPGAPNAWPTTTCSMEPAFPAPTTAASATPPQNVYPASLDFTSPIIEPAHLASNLALAASPTPSATAARTVPS